MADVLIDTRLAADTSAPTRMDRPEDVDVNPVNGRVYACLTNNDLRGSQFPVDEPNPIGDSQIRDDHRRAADGLRAATATATSWRWRPATATTTGRLRLAASCWSAATPRRPRPTSPAPQGQGQPHQLPRQRRLRQEGNLWISTDGNKLGSNDGLFRVPTAGPQRGQVKQFLTVPPGAETCGPVIARDQHTVFVRRAAPGRGRRRDLRDADQHRPTGDFPRPSVVAAYQR